MLHSLTTFYQSIPADTWQVLGLALGLSGLVQALKHYFFSKLSAHALMTITTLVAFLASAIQWAESASKSNPTILGQHTAMLVGLMTLAYRYVVAPSYGVLMDAKAQRTAQTQTTEPASTSEASF